MKYFGISSGNVNVLVVLVEKSIEEGRVERPYADAATS
jgi:hypothetical protein